MTREFRTGVFAAEADLVERQPVLHQLGRLFAQLHSGKKIAVDSAPFANTLELDNAVQQDGQEFLKLLLTLLERVLGMSQNQQARNVVQNVFRGTFSYVTKCSKCGQESDASREAVDFYELELNVKGFTSLEESLNDYLCEEKLQGENQYLCESCQMRVDATHSTKLRSLPPVLNFQLKRFVFNTKTSTKKKVTSKFSFPKTIDMGPRLSAPPALCGGQNMAVYDLSAILIHRGTLVNSGHYVAHIKDDQTGEWWQFDDEQVMSLGFHALGEHSQAGPVTKDAALREGETILLDVRGDGAIDNQTAQPCVHEPSLSAEVSPKPSPVMSASHEGDVLTSADAYMLMYSRRTEPELWGHTNSGTCSSAGLVEPVTMEVDEEPRAYGYNCSLPEQLHVEVDEMNQEFEALCSEYTRRRAEELSKIADRKKEVRGILGQAPVKSVDDPFFWISTEWLRLWADNLRPPPPIDNTHLVCHHQKVPPRKVQHMKRISSKAWKQLVALYKGGPELSESDYCIECIFEDAKAAASADSYRDQRACMREVVEDVFAGHGLEGKLFNVSRTWLLQWVRRKVTDAPSDADAGPTAALQCPHGALLPEQATGAKRQLVPQRVWDYFVQNAVQIASIDRRGHQPFPGDLDTCAQCQAEMNKAASKKEGLRATKIEQRAKHEALYSGKQVVIHSGSTYYLVPSVWLSKWRTYLGASGKNVLAVDEPVGLEGFILSLLCQKHEGMLFKPPALLRTRRGDLVQRNSSEDVFTIVTEEDWQSLCQQWDMDLKKGIQAVVEPCSPELESSKGITIRDEGEAVPLCEETSASNTCNGDMAGSREISSTIATDIGTPPDDGNCKAESVPALRTHPEVCKECIEERETLELLTRLQYTNGEITVDLVRGKGPPPSLLVASSGLEAERRTSKRPRRGVSHFWRFVKENQRVHFGKVELVDESATLADLNILPGAHLWVMDTGQHENRDIAEELPAEDTGRVETEEGFRGTRLLMGLPSLVESLATHAVQSGIVPPNPTFSNGTVPRYPCPSAGEHTVDPETFKVLPSMQQVTEAALPDLRSEEDQVAEEKDSTSAEASGMMCLCFPNSRIPSGLLAEQGPELSVVEEPASVQQVQDVDMGSVKGEEGDSDQDMLASESLTGLPGLMELPSVHAVSCRAAPPGISSHNGNETKVVIEEAQGVSVTMSSSSTKEVQDTETHTCTEPAETNLTHEADMEIDRRVELEEIEVDSLSRLRHLYDVDMEQGLDGMSGEPRIKEESKRNTYQLGAQPWPTTFSEGIP